MLPVELSFATIERIKINYIFHLFSLPRFSPFADGLLKAAEAGATAVIQPGGSMRDDEVIAAADEAGLAMVFTGMRHFRH